MFDAKETELLVRFHVGFSGMGGTHRIRTDGAELVGFAAANIAVVPWTCPMSYTSKTISYIFNNSCLSDWP